MVLISARLPFPEVFRHACSCPPFRPSFQFPTVPCFTYWTQPPAQEWKRGNGRNVAPSSSQKHKTRKAERKRSTSWESEPSFLLADCCRLTTYSLSSLVAFPFSLPAAGRPIRALSRCLKYVCVCVCHHSDPSRQHRLESCLVSATTLKDNYSVAQDIVPCRLVLASIKPY